MGSLLYKLTTKYVYITIQTLYLLVNTKTLIWFDAMDDIQSSQWNLSNTSLIDISHNVHHCTASHNYLCARLRSLSYIIKYTNVINYTSIDIEYHPSGSCSFHYILNNSAYKTLPSTTYAIVNLGIEFKNINALDACYIDEVSLYGEYLHHETTVDSMRIALIGACVVVSCCICLVLFCWCRFKSLHLNHDAEPASPPFESSIPSSKFRKMFGLDSQDSSNKKDPQKQQGLGAHVLNTSPVIPALKMPTIGAVSTENALRSFYMTTPGSLDASPAPSLHLNPQSVDKKPAVLKLSGEGHSNESSIQRDNRKLAMDISHEVNEHSVDAMGYDAYEYKEGQSIENSTVISVKKTKLTWYPTIKQEGKKDLVVVERGFQHKASAFEIEKKNEEEIVEEEESDVTQNESGSHEHVLISDIVGDHGDSRLQLQVIDI
eukprot:310274_1